jgi:DNA-binding response OmpR family regulator
MGTKTELSARPEIWILEDDPHIGDTYGELLSELYSLKFYRQIADFRTALENTPHPSLVIADLTLPDGNFVRALEGGDFGDKLDRVPHMVVSGADDPVVMQKCFDMGCADFLLKPIRLNELRVKITRSLETPFATTGKLSFDPSTHTVRFEGKDSEPLTSKEYQILSTLFQAPNNMSTRAEVLSRVWTASKVVSKTLDVHIFHLRKKLAAIGVAIRHRAPDSFQIDFSGQVGAD